MLWILTAVWLVALVFTAWRHMRAPSKGRLVAYLVVGLIGLVPYLWLLWTDQLPDTYRYLMTTLWVAIALVAVWDARRRRAGQ